ncbi:MAG: hypothetical protein HY296_03030 [Thaumarchaeota archaeon]|nr:hypothetical protein [Nitrososphaerota archaeon]
MQFVTPERARIFQVQADLYLLTLLLGVLLITYGLVGLLTSKIRAMRGLGSIPLSLSSLVPHLLSNRKYFRVFVVSSIAYGLFYSLVTSILVYQPALKFSEAYGVAIPSATVTPCCGPPLLVPVVTVYLTENLGLLIVPLTVVLLLIVSVLVGLNLAISFYAYDHRARSGGRWLLGLGGVIGLFTGCPTCAGLFFATMVGGTGVAGFATVLAYYQPLFVGASIPILAVTPSLTSRNIAKVFKQGCIVVDQSPRGLLG